MARRGALRRDVEDSQSTLLHRAPSSGAVEPASQKVNGITIPRHRLLGAYYTPADVAETLVRWALDGTPGKLLDPSFGGCAFLEAGTKILGELGCERPGRKVFGVDLDPGCIDYVRKISQLCETNCTFEDFLAIAPESISGAPFQAITGNPPYVRHHWLKDEKRDVARQIAEESTVKIPETASLWAYFVVHSLAFLARGGRMAMLVPEAILQADYASVVRDVLKESFDRVRLIHIRERLFKGTDEPVVVIAAEQFGKRGSLEVLSVDTALEVGAILRGFEISLTHTTLENGRRVPPEALEAMARVKSSDRVRSFGDLATTRIGIVTGANSHFIRSARDLQDLGVPAKARTGIVSRTKWLAGLDFTRADQAVVEDDGARAYLVRPTPSLDTHRGVVGWIEEGEEAKVHDNHKCQKRDPWFRVDLPLRPDAFVTSTRLGPPLLVLNRTALRCTNALYASKFRLPEGVLPESVALGFFTTYVALWSEINGRRYGGGVLKLDLTRLGQLPLPVVAEASVAFDEVNAALRLGNEMEARALADEVVLHKGIGINLKDIFLMRTALADLMRQRIPGAKDTPDG